VRTTNRGARAAVTVAAATVLAVMATACTDDGGEAGGPAGGAVAAPDLQLASSLQPIESCEGLSAWLRDEVAPRVTEYGLSPGDRFGVMEDLGAAGDAEMRAAPDAAVATTAESTAAASQPAPGGDDAAYSGTNVQVAGVDEPDIVKTDGERILAVTGGRLHLVSVAQGREVAAVDLPADLGITDLLLAGDRAILIGTSWAAVPFADDAPSGAIPEERRDIAPTTASTVVAEVDIAGDSLTLGDTYSLDGTYVSARMTDDVVRLVLRTSPADALPFVSPANGSGGAVEAAREHNRRVVEEAAPEDLLPRWHRIGTERAPADEGALLGCEDVHAPNTFAGFALVAVASIDIGDGLATGVTRPGATAVLATGDTVYASPEHLYVAAPAWIEPRPLEPSTDVAPEVEEPGTDIHRFDITDPARAVYDMSGHVDGSLLGQFALDENDGHLRVATTTGFSWAGVGEDAPESESHVVVLAPGDGALERVGEVGGLGRGEDIQSVRFLGDVGYVVTFERTDPLYTLDLADPAAPRVAGELEIPGYSAYLHPVADGWLLGVGQDATVDGSTTGTQVSLFDVRDPAAPNRVAQVAFPGASSAAESDHRAFLWWADAGLAAIPLSRFTPECFDGLVGLTVDLDAATLAERGRVNHPGEPCGFIDRPVPLPEPVPLPIEPGAGGGSDSSSSSSGTAIAPGEPPPDGRPIAPPAPIQRALVVGDRLWTLSDQGMASSDLATLTDTVFVPFG
jgi:Beta propeller domain